MKPGKRRRSPPRRWRRRQYPRIMGAKLTDEADLSPDASDLEVPAPVAPSDLPDRSSTRLADPARTDPSKAESPPERAGDDPRPWVKLGQRRLPDWAYRRLPNWFYPDRTHHEPYWPSRCNVDRTSTSGVVAAGADVDEAPEEVFSDEEEEDPWRLY